MPGSSVGAVDAGVCMTKGPSRSYGIAEETVDSCQMARRAVNSDSRVICQDVRRPDQRTVLCLREEGSSQLSSDRREKQGELPGQRRPS